QGLLNQAKFDIFDLSDSLRFGNAHQAIKVLKKLAGDNTEAMSILWTLNKEANTLLSLQQGLANGESFHQLCTKNGIWKNQQSAVQQALRRLNIVSVEYIISLLAQFDANYKQGQLVAPYQALAHICLVFCQPLKIPLPCHKRVD
ncbi:MAG: DNA polymerase III subunit delta, partial [Pseudoalteromonas sp.]